MSIAKRGAAIFLPTMLYIMAHTSERAYEAVGPGSDLRDALGDPADELSAGCWSRTARTCDSTSWGSVSNPQCSTSQPQGCSSSLQEKENILLRGQAPGKFTLKNLISRPFPL
ncbi:hypothetical protein WJX77_005373 [Trebouxia sp. C0004]